MPTKPKRPCSYPGCPLLTNGRYCVDHKKLTDNHYNKYQRDRNHHKRYGKEWWQIRHSYITANPLCEECKKDGRLTPAKEVHHIKPLADGGTHDDNNLMSLCKQCHSSITAREGGRWGWKSTDIYLKRGWVANWDLTNLHLKSFYKLNIKCLSRK